MADITDNKFTNDFIQRMIKGNATTSPRLKCRCYVKKSNISKNEILACWKNGLSYCYKDEYRTRRPDVFIQAKSDGSEFLVRLVIPEHAIYASDILYENIKKLCSRKNGFLYYKISDHPPFRYRRRKKDNMRPVTFGDSY
nr:hypothetical protein [Parabacteroides goldsteinii]